jgi:acetyltransferase-like isoleucine patch superfamily enzyme
MSPRTLLKSAAFWAATVAVLPALASYWLRAGVLGGDRALEGSTQVLSLVPGVLGQYLRRAFLSRALLSCHPSVTVEFGTIFSRRNARIDEDVYLGPGCHLGLVHIERDVLLAAGVHVPSGPNTHGIADIETPIRNQAGSQRIVRIGANSWIGSAAVVLQSVGRNTIVGAGSVVTHPLPDRVMAAGVPCKVLRHRDAADRQLA